MAAYDPENKDFFAIPVPEPFVSVIVPVYNDERRIGKCISSLLEQTYPKDRYEVIIVDNGSIDGTVEIIRNYTVKLFIENNIKSSYAARNKGILESKGEIIAFTDSDCIPDVDWIRKGVLRLVQDPECGLLGGKIKLFYKNPKNLNAIEVYERVTNFRQKEDLAEHKFASTANVFTRKTVIGKVGLFNDQLRSGGDNEWGRRIYSAGIKQTYANEVVVDHPARYSYKEMRQRTKRLIGGCYDQYWRNSYRAHIKESFKNVRDVLALSARLLLGMSPSEKLTGISEKIKFIIILAYVQAVGFLERTRLLIGGEPSR